MTTPQQQLAGLLAQQAITEQIHRYCRAIDRCDRALLASVFHPDSTHAHGGYAGSSADFCGFAIDLIERVDACQHQTGNILIDFVSDDLAFSETYWTAFQRILAGVTLGAAFADHNLAIDEDIVIGGRYLDRFEKRDGIWKIAHRTGVHDWQRWAPSEPRSFHQAPADQRGARGAADLTYQFSIDGAPHVFLQRDAGVHHG